MLTEFKQIDRQLLPKPGDLIRNRKTGDFINLVRAVEETPKGLWVKSTRYAKIFAGEVTYLWGKRSRGFVWRPVIHSGGDGVPGWEVVAEYDKVPMPTISYQYRLRDNGDQKRAMLVESYDTYTPPAGEANES